MTLSVFTGRTKCLYRFITDKAYNLVNHISNHTKVHQIVSKNLSWHRKHFYDNLFLKNDIIHFFQKKR